MESNIGKAILKRLNQDESKSARKKRNGMLNRLREDESDDDP